MNMEERQILLGAGLVAAIFIVIYFVAGNQAMPVAKYVGDKMLYMTIIGGIIAIILRLIDRYFDNENLKNKRRK